MERFRKAACQGDADAHYALGGMYYKGQGVSLDYAEAAICYHKAANQWIAGAQNHLGIIYFEGAGVPRDYVLALMWVTLAAFSHDQNLKLDEPELVRVAIDLLRRETLPADPSPG